jgi:putative endonuclease
MPREQRIYAVYIMASGKNGTLYVGVSCNLVSRIVQHRNKEIRGFTSRYNITQLV